MDQRILITGATSGIGEQLATIFARHGRNLVLVGRNNSKLQKVADKLKKSFSISLDCFVQDLSQPQAAQNVRNYCTRKGFSVDTLVNNAGYGSFGPFSQSDIKVEANMLELNNSTVMKMCRLFLPDMLAHHDGRILNVSSMAAYIPGPYWATYAASKSFILSFCDALSAECRGTGVSVTALCPGPTDTDFSSAAGIGNRGAFKMLPHMSAQAVAEYGYRSLIAGKATAIPGILNKVEAFLSSVTPRAILRPALLFIQSR